MDGFKNYLGDQIDKRHYGNQAVVFSIGPSPSFKVWIPDMFNQYCWPHLSLSRLLVWDQVGPRSDGFFAKY